MKKTPEQKWKDALVQYRKKCQSILGISKNVRYCGIINKYGRTLVGIIRPGVTPLWSSEQVKNEFFIISTLMTLRKDPSKTVGDLEYLVLKHKKVTILAFQKNDLTYYISVNKNAKDLPAVIPKIRKMI